MGENQKTHNGGGRREFSSGGVVFKRIDGKILWLIAKTAPSELFPKQVWRLPKGWIDDMGEGIPGPVSSGKRKATEDELQETALREVREEGGVKAKIIKKIGTTKYFYKFPKVGNILKFVTFYLMEWIGDHPEGHDGETSETAWLPFELAKNQLEFPRDKEILKKETVDLDFEISKASSLG